METGFSVLSHRQGETLSNSAGHLGETLTREALSWRRRRRGLFLSLSLIILYQMRCPKKKANREQKKTTA